MAIALDELKVCDHGYTTVNPPSAQPRLMLALYREWKYEKEIDSEGCEEGSYPNYRALQ